MEILILTFVLNLCMSTNEESTTHPLVATGPLRPFYLKKKIIQNYKAHSRILDTVLINEQKQKTEQKTASLVIDA